MGYGLARRLEIYYKLTRFLPDGTSVQAKIDQLTLKEVDESFRQVDSRKEYVVDRAGNGR
ncbi:MAG: hypothetical protein AB4038_05600 [Prochloraceae cyanobacterium]